MPLDASSVRTHSRFAPSSLERVLACPRSVSLAEALGGQGHRSRYAAEGSVAHEIAAQMLQDALPVAVGTIVEYDGHQITVDAAMHEHGAAYALYVCDLLGMTGRLYVEQTVRLDAIVGPEADMYGHLDAAVWSPETGELHVIDYKYGAGVRVEPFDNPQLKAYALGAMFSLPEIDPAAVRYVYLHVFQPRIPGAAVGPDKIAAADLLLWGHTELAPVVSLILQDGAVEKDYVTGDHCRWCPALSHCPAMRDRANRAAQKAFADPPVAPRALTTAELADVLDEIDVIEPWFAAARQEAERRAIEDNDVPRDRKLVEGKSRRVWSVTVERLPALLKRCGLQKADIYEEPAIRSVAQIETRLKKLKTARLDVFETLWERKPGGLRLVRSTNARPAVHANKAEDVFDRVPAPPADLTDPD